MKESVQVWKQRLHDAREIHKKVVEETNKYCEAYNSGFANSFPGMRGDRTVDNFSYNYVYKILNVARANILFKRPVINIPASTPDEVDTAPVIEAVINRIIEDSDIENELKRQFDDAFLRGSGFIKFGYHSEHSPSDKNISADGTEAVDLENSMFINGEKPEAHMDEDHDLHMAGHQMLIDNYAGEILKAKGMPALLNIIMHIEEHRKLQEKRSNSGTPNWKLKPNAVWARHVDFRDILLDSNATRFEDCRWIAFRSIHVLQGVKASDVYKNTSNLEGTKDIGRDEGELEVGSHLMARLAASTSKSIADYQDDKDDFRVELWEIWDKETQQILVVTDQSDRFLRKERAPYRSIPGFFPVSRLTFNEKVGTTWEDEPARVYGYSWVTPWWPQQVALNKAMTVEGQHVKACMPKWVAGPGVSQNFIQKVTRGEPNAITQLSGKDGGSIDITQAITPITFPDTPVALQRYISELQDQIAFLSGFGEISLGGQSTARTATAAAIQQQQQSAYAESLVVEVERAFQQSAKVIRALARQFYTQDRVMRIEGEDFGGRWVRFKGEDLTGDRIDVVPGSSKPAVDALKRQQWMGVLELAAKVQDPRIDLLKIMEQLYRSMGVQHPEAFFKDVPMVPVGPDGQPVAPGQGPATGDVASRPQNLGEMQADASAVDTPAQDTGAQGVV